MAKATGRTGTAAANEGVALVIVESPTKANTIRKFLGGPYLVEASVGHVRDLVTKKTDLSESDERRTKSWVHYGVNVENHFEPLEEIYLVPADKQRQVTALKQALAKANRLYLATDDDREGEAISWHLMEVLKPKVPVERLVFHEITGDAIATALRSTRPLDQNLVVAQRTRRVVDRLFGWDVSQVLWRKIKPGLSAGRVQSVALRLLVQRERERMAFVSSTYWDLTATLKAQQGEAFHAALARVGERKVATGKDFDDTTGKLLSPQVLQLDEAQAAALQRRLAGRQAKVLKVDVKPLTQRPSPPFTTSTLQQEGSRKLRFSAKQTMQVAQKLYENGFITYMRTDSTTLSEQALTAARQLIEATYGAAYLPPQPRRYQTRSMNAQEAHEAIRPAGTQFLPVTEVERSLGREAARLYDLIWKRTVASQMPDARIEQTSVDIGIDDAVFRASGRVTRFAGFLQAYVEGKDEAEEGAPRTKVDEDREGALPAMQAGDVLAWGPPPALEATGHETRPPARMTDASLIKSLEDKGIGRPSTYAAILQGLLDKGYCFRRGSSALVPTFMGMAVIQMLEAHMPHLVDYNFTAEMEARLDAIARGEVGCASYLRGFYEEGFPGLGSNGRVKGLVDLLSDVRDHIDPVTASSVPIGQTPAGEPVAVRIGRYGTFVQAGERRANVPDDLAPDEMTVQKAAELCDAKQKGEAPLGQDPKTGLDVFLRNGRFGWYLMLGLPAKDEDAPKPKMVSLSKGMKPEEVTLEVALRQLALPRTLGRHPKTGQEVVAHVGRYGDYVKSGDETRTLPPGVLAATVDLDAAVAALDKPRSTAGKTHVRDIGVRAADGKTLSLWTGRYGLYLTDGNVNKTLGDAIDPDALTVAQADDLLQAAAQARTGRVLGVDPATGGEVRLLDGRFGPYLTNGATNASLARGTEKDDLTLEEALDRLKHFGKPVKKKKGARGAGVARKTGATEAKAGGKAKAGKGATKAKAASKTAKPGAGGDGEAAGAAAGQATAKPDGKSAAKKPAAVKSAAKTAAAKKAAATAAAAAMAAQALAGEVVSRRSAVRSTPAPAVPEPVRSAVVRRRPASPGV